MNNRKYSRRKYITKEINRPVTKLEEGALYSHPLSSLPTEANGSWGMWKLISYVSLNMDSMTHS